MELNYGPSTAAGQGHGAPPRGQRRGAGLISHCCSGVQRCTRTHDSALALPLNYCSPSTAPIALLFPLRQKSHGSHLMPVAPTPSPPAREHRDVKAGGVRLRVAHEGRGDPVLLLHGLFVDHTSWNGVASHLRSEFRVIAPDLPGFGASEKPPRHRFAYNVSAFSEAVADLYAGLGLGRAAVVGHALGGAVALTLAARHPELVSHLVLVDALCFDAPPYLERRIALLPLVGSFYFRQLWGRTGFRTLFRERLLAPGASVPAERIDGYYDAFNTPAARGSALSTLRETVDTRNVEAQTSLIKARTLVLWGRADRLYPPELGQRLARQIKGAGFQLLDAGHSPHEEQSAELAFVVARFLKDHRPHLG